MKIYKDEKPHIYAEVKLSDGRILHNDEIFEEEERRGKELNVRWNGHVCYRAPIGSPKGTFLYEEISQEKVLQEE